MGSTSYSTAGSFTWTAPAGVTSVNATIKGGGGSGGSFVGGGGGGCSVLFGNGVTPGSDYAVLVGSGGASAAGPGFSGNNGSPSSFNSAGTAEGGTPGLGSPVSAPGGTGLNGNGGAGLDGGAGGQAGTTSGNGADGGATGQPGDGGTLDPDTGFGPGVDGLVQIDWDDPVSAPDTPADLAATTNQLRHIPTSWTASAGATGYRIYRDDDGYTTPIFDGAGTAYDDTALGDGVTHSYKVLAYNDGGASAKSGSVSATTRAAAKRSAVSCLWWWFFQ